MQYFHTARYTMTAIFSSARAGWKGDNGLKYVGISGLLVGLAGSKLFTKVNTPINMMISDLSKKKRNDYMVKRDADLSEKSARLAVLRKEWVAAYTVNLRPDKLAEYFIDDEGLVKKQTSVKIGNFASKALDISWDHDLLKECKYQTQKEIENYWRPYGIQNIEYNTNDSGMIFRK